MKLKSVYEGINELSGESYFSVYRDEDDPDEDCALTGYMSKEDADYIVKCVDNFEEMKLLLSFTLKEIGERDHYHLRMAIDKLLKKIS